LLALVFLALGITLIAFVLSHLVPGDPVSVALGEQASVDPLARAAFIHRYGLDRPIPEQYLVYMQHLLQGDLGNSIQSGRPVGHDLSVAIPATLEVAVVAVTITVIVGIGMGLGAALRQDSWIDQVLRIASLAGVSVPTFWLALVAYYVFFFKLGWSPSGGRLDPALTPPPHVTGLYTVDALLAGDLSLAASAASHLALPATVLAAYTVSFVARFTRSAVLEVLAADYVLAARAKGLPERTVVFKYVLRAALVPIITLVGLAFGSLLSGTVLVETIFSWPGVGQYAYRASTSLDLNAIMGVSLFVAVAYVTVNFAVDLLYGVVDPRIRVG
jgi:peptide/nickel transport system permease protein